ncbi:MAG: DUF4259 domain-containing protein [Candidatus Thiodiazotropha lotti]|nr:DUF4259 domain-containing protein [Candidatus Thiodiazotropha lotti]MCG7989875.1 DUF4259 domain-containing protein [Candidatus Thiodiazotropha lotti]MCG8002296.1 DUF4259 domain-containing protein [Candidatus Thiodiazotropha lotti]MCG8009881.1 DUF4259 domain-containing protein [Candidatus Thiodiazotropha lotti]MCG8022277.1 DUF4259 domain-containing protein [Candidatus Thiodiazotropha lotti]
MGAWSHEPFGNDDANDWAYGLEGFVDLSLIEKTLDRALEAEKYLEAPKALEAVAAVEVLAKLLGKGTQTDTYTEKVDEWCKSISAQPSAAILTKANRALERILGENSELRELWEKDDAQEWHSSITGLQRAISA